MAAAQNSTHLVVILVIRSHHITIIISVDILVIRNHLITIISHCGHPGHPEPPHHHHLPCGHPGHPDNHLIIKIIVIMYFIL